MVYQNVGGYGQQAPFAPLRKRERPQWAQSLRLKQSGRVARQFVLHFNINDFVVDLTRVTEVNARGQPKTTVKPECFDLWEKPLTFREYLHSLLFDDFGCQSVYTYTLASGMLASDRQSLGIGQPLKQELGPGALVTEAIRSLGGTDDQAGQQVDGDEVDVPRDVPTCLRILGHLLRKPHYLQNAQGQRVEAPIAVVLDYCEKLIPFHVGEGQGQVAQLQALETMQSWAIDPRIRDTSNIIILLTSNSGLLAASVLKEGSGTQELRVPLPDEDTRLAFIRRKQLIMDARQRMANIARAFAPRTSRESDSTFTPEKGLARATQGMRLADIDGLNRETVMRWLEMDINQQMTTEHAVGPAGAFITPEVVREAKATAIERQSSELLEIIPPERGYNEIGGMVELKKYLARRTDMMAKGRHSPLIPSGLLLAGPPGTGKTIIAEALATEGQFNLVKMRNIQDRWVGSSERNLDMVLSLLKDLHPVVVFVDEIDQAMGQRNTGQSGDSGVSARMFARILQEMSKASNRGRILWVAATNRTDILDDALLRRFDRVVPLLAPDATESRRIFAAMPTMLGKQSGNDINITYGGDLAQSNRLDADGRPHPTDADLARFNVVAERSARLGLTGAEIEIIVRRAAELAAERTLDAGHEVGDNDLPPIISDDLDDAMDDFKINHNPSMYDYQSLLAIRSCNFYSILPKPLPNRPIFREIVDAQGRVDPNLLDNAIDKVARQLAPQDQQAQAARRPQSELRNGRSHRPNDDDEANYDDA